ncbi:heat shock factor-binding protein 1-like protein 1 [Stigmatopora argus]
MSTSKSKATEELTQVMEETMNRVEARFQAITEQLGSQIDEMGTRINSLEENVMELTAQASMDDLPISKVTDPLPQ